MRRVFIVKLFILAVLVSSCNEGNKGSQNHTPSYDTSKSDVVGNSVIIKNDSYSRGIDEQNIYESLKGRSGIYEVFYIDYEIDYYGKKTETKNRLGTIDADELNKFEHWRYWKGRTGGVQEMFDTYKEKKKSKYQ